MQKLCKGENYNFVYMLSFNKKYQYIKGTLVAERAGINVELPDGWSAMKLDDYTYMISPKNETGVLNLFIQHLAVAESGLLLTRSRGGREDRSNAGRNI